ncbi:hypothetical protein ACTWP5_12590 [Streptomyces sp. 4N509B]|uniref:hypothetical protein n=1 Tax=Streptomyces sp. 4N509B TaxID=3457413 RepID=UPI003FD557AE
MSRTPTRSALRAATVAAVALGTLAVPATALAEHPDHLVDFAADTGDGCLMGSTGGTLTRPARHEPGRLVVEVTGTVTDGSPFCEFVRDDEMYAVASFAAYTGDRLVDQAAAYADNGTEPVAATLVAADDGPVERVVVQVCRYLVGSGPATAPGTCGEPRTYRP